MSAGIASQRAASGVRPGPFAVGVVALYALLLLPLAASRHFDLSVFVRAGSTFTDRARLPEPIAVMDGSIGYDGQFFYRLALDPLATGRAAFGITLDDPAKRMQRIVYPALAWLAAAGRAPLVPATLLLVNLAGLAVIAAAVAAMARRHALAAWFPVAIVAWPGFLVSLTHDTAEITTGALLLTALACYLSDRIFAYAMLAAAASLTRETAVPVLLGIVAYEAVSAGRSWHRAALCAAALLPFAAWWLAMSWLWRQSPQSAGSPDLGWPLVGLAAMVAGNLDGSRTWTGNGIGDIGSKLYVLFAVGGLLSFCAIVAMRLRYLRIRPGMGGLALGWLMLLALLSMLTADGPWNGPQSYFRAFTECWILGCILLAFVPAPPMRQRWPALLIAAAFVQTYIVIWKWSLLVLPFPPGSS